LQELKTDLTHGAIISCHQRQSFLQTADRLTNLNNKYYQKQTVILFTTQKLNRFNFD